jgi:AraC-like DNA-binding protein
MIYSEHYTSAPLSRFVEKIWYCKADTLINSCLTLPMPYHELVFNFSENYRIGPAGNQASVENSVAWISGLHSKPYYSFSSGRHEMLGILFKPDGLSAFQKYQAKEFCDKFTDASLVFGPTVNFFLEQVYGAQTLSEKIALTEKFLLKQLLPYHHPSYLGFTANRLKIAATTKGGIGQLCRQASVTNKSLIEAYKKHIGFRPARYAKLEKVNQALMLLAENPRQSLTSLAYELGFFDQSHFISSFKSFTTLTPRAYTSLILAGQVDPSAPNFISLQG